METGESKKTKRKNFKLETMSSKTGLTQERIKEILMNPKKDKLRNVQKSKLLNNGALKKYPTLVEAKEVCKSFSQDSKEYEEAFEVWEWYSFLKVSRACTLSLLVDALEVCPEGSFPETLAVQRIAEQLGFRSREDLD